MTFKILQKIISANNIPEDVTLMSDSGWECSETDMDGVYYNPKENVIIFTQWPYSWDNYFKNPSEWILLYGKKDSCDGDWGDREVPTYDQT